MSRPDNNTRVVNAAGYYERTEVSNSDLTELKNLLHPRQQFGDREAAFRFGSLVDAMVTEPDRVNFYRHTVDDVVYPEWEFRKGVALRDSLRRETTRDQFLAQVLDKADTQTVMVNKEQRFEYGGFPFTLATRCKWDWFLHDFGIGGDLKTTFASSQHEFEQAVDFFDWDRSRAWYMDIAGTDRDFIYAISKRTGQVFKKFITRGDETYNRGREKYLELAFQYWCLDLVPRAEALPRPSTPALP